MSNHSDLRDIETGLNQDASSDAALDSLAGPAALHPTRKATLRLGQRQLSLISLAVILLVVGGLCLGAYQVYLNFRITRDIIVAEDNMRALYKAMHGYAADWDNKLPDASQWTDQVAGYLSAPPDTPGGKLSYLHGEDEHGNPIHYVYNDLASNYNLEPVTATEQRKAIEPNRLVLLIEAPGEGANEHVRIPPQNTPEGQEALYKLLTFPHNSADPDKATTVVLFANGTPVRFTRKDLK